jgi:hypothetical protein
MLRITTTKSDHKIVLEIEGRLAGPWVDELERCWRELPPGMAVNLWLRAVTFIDEAGRDLLARLHRSGAELKATGCMTSCIVQQITSAARQTDLAGRSP